MDAPDSADRKPPWWGGPAIADDPLDPDARGVGDTLAELLQLADERSRRLVVTVRDGVRIRVTDRRHAPEDRPDHWDVGLPMGAVIALRDALDEALRRR